MYFFLLSFPTFGPDHANPSHTQSDATVEDDVLFNVNGGVGTIVLNRPSKLNSLNQSMIDKLTPKVLEYVKNDSIKALVLKGAGGKALCAGGDVAALASGISKNGNAGSVDATTFFRDEYILVQLIATLSKPYVALMHGITMGGGVGVSVHAPFRIATEKTLFAMPETDIGFFPDVGGTYFLSRLDGEIGTYLALTSARLRGYDVVSAGIATHYIPSDRLPALEKRLAEATTESSSKNQFELVNSVLNEFEVDAPKDYKFSLAGKTRKLIDRAFGKNTIQEVVTELENDGSEFALATKDIILARSPTSVAVTLQALRRGKKIGVSEALDKEYRLSENFMYHHDFVEGVSAKLISKPARKPQYIPAKLDSVTQRDITVFLATKSNSPSADIEFINTDDFLNYPYNFGLPTEQEVLSVLSKSTKQQTIDHFKNNIKPGVSRRVSEILADI